MTVAELIAALATIEDKGRKVWVEGCDCANPAKSVNEKTMGGHVLIEAEV